MVSLQADEHIHRGVVQGLQERGVDIRTAEAFNLGGASDERLLDHCHKRGRVLLTNDDDLLRLAEKQAHAGIIFQTTQFLAPGELLWAMLRVIDTVTEDQVRGNVFYVP